MAGLVIPIQLEGGGGARHTNTRSATTRATTRAVKGTLRKFTVTRRRRPLLCRTIYLLKRLFRII